MNNTVEYRGQWEMHESLVIVWQWKRRLGRHTNR